MKFITELLRTCVYLLQYIFLCCSSFHNLPMGIISSVTFIVRLTIYGSLVVRNKDAE